jgi:hypothetical protein
MIKTALRSHPLYLAKGGFSSPKRKKQGTGG